ncbi:hypothetical protein O9G_006098 [Rozella allomycis CSF55]|uniref:Uncharacterized protein n=1 Tax=Rozella allomycis (strain CSF55) TaxID=988480 RepID=A0A075AS15_ROZAC|nr:hypothetical protein O9G_006098 [Rozella allomycis CSF55]|eukprot:EPZ33028.1 hypothetical protein O9G_006098 [Rozella allomycis CSF55]
MYLTGNLSYETIWKQRAENALRQGLSQDMEEQIRMTAFRIKSAKTKMDTKLGPVALEYYKDDFKDAKSNLHKQMVSYNSSRASPDQICESIVLNN